jgi:hypothetical protein
MDKTFCRIQHDHAVKKDLFKVKDPFSKVKDADVKNVGRDFKDSVKS